MSFVSAFTSATFGLNDVTSQAVFTPTADQQIALRSGIDLSLFFRTTAPRGLLAYIGPPPTSDVTSYLAVVVSDSRIAVMISDATFAGPDVAVDDAKLNSISVKLTAS